MATRMAQSPPEDHARGATDARVTLIQYGDYQCPRCAAAEPVLAAILTRHPAGLRFVFRHFPAVEAHPMATLAAEAAEYAAMHGLFWPMHAALLAHARHMSLAVLFALADELRLPANHFRDALAIGLCEKRVRRDIDRGLADGVVRTPAFFINGYLHRDGPIGPALEAAIDPVTNCPPARSGMSKVASP